MSLLLRDPRARLALGIAVLEVVFVGVMTNIGSAEDFPLVVSVLIVASALQIGALFYNQRGGFSQAQKLFVSGDYEQAIAQLEAQEQRDSKAETLLGNAYRQNGQLEKSESTLRAVLEASPRDAFPLYGLGRTLLAQGRFSAASETIGQAVELGGRKVIRAELALAHFLEGRPEAAKAEALRAVRNLQMEPHRHLMMNYILHQVDDDSRAAEMMPRFMQGLTYWQHEARRFSNTQYGVQLQEVITHIEGMQ